ncbi:cytochrome P450 [Actinosynnema sp. NPDC020468]|uniref:cytochrome P450 n=1 Tax=Actinosynnema sp. NPDC020468 TaxID=3154488 RepID=UPI0033C9A076
MLPRFDASADAVLDDPYPEYARLRAAGGLGRGGPGQWVVSRHAEVAALLRDRRLSTDYPEDYHRYSVGDGPAVDFFRRIVLDRDPPAHTRLRRLMALAPSVVRAAARRVERTVDELLRDRTGLDVVADLAVPLPVSVICDLLGVPPADRDVVRDRVADLARGFAVTVRQQDRAAAHDAVVWLREYMAALPARSGLLAALRAGTDRAEADDNAVFLFFAGFETTANLIATGFDALTRHPDQWALLRADPDRAPAAVEEFLRYDAPIQAAARMVAEPVAVGDRVLRPGRLVVLLLGSANHDETVFADPTRLDITRAPNPHVGFGGGAHTCLGAALARAEGVAVFRWLARNRAVLDRAGEAERRRAFTFRAFTALPVTLA